MKFDGPLPEGAARSSFSIQTPRIVCGVFSFKGKEGLNGVAKRISRLEDHLDGLYRGRWPLFVALTTESAAREAYEASEDRPTTGSEIRAMNRGELGLLDIFRAVVMPDSIQPDAWNALAREIHGLLCSLGLGAWAGETFHEPPVLAILGRCPDRYTEWESLNEEVARIAARYGATT